MEFAEHNKYSFQAGKAKVSEDWSHLLELNLRNVITMRLGRDWATSLCSVFNVTVFSHARTLSCGRTIVCRSASMPQPDPCRQLRVPECLVKADSCGCGTEESRAVKGASWVHGICMQVLTVWDTTYKFLPRHTAQENGVLKFPDLREVDAVLESGAECAHTHDAVCGSL